MKTSRKWTIVLLSVIAMLCLTLFVACTEEDIPSDQSSYSQSSQGSSASATEYTVTFVTNGGEPVGSLTIEANGLLTLPSTTKQNGKLKGWYDNAGLSGTLYTAGTRVFVKANVTYYAAWEQVATYKLTLDVDGGSVATSVYDLVEGQVVYDVISSVVPEKENCVFGAWLMDGRELTRNYKMPARELTITAKYKYKYTVEIYKQNESLDGYELADTVTDHAYVGTSVDYDEDITGFKRADAEGQILNVTVGEDVSKNVLKYYFDRRTYRLTLNSNYEYYGAIEENETKSVTVAFGEEYALPDHPFDFAGFTLLGWATTQSGDIVYPTDYVGDNYYGRSGETAEAATITLTKDTVLYAKWLKGYVDMFGGGDYVYLFDGKDVYLERGGVFFKGEYDAKEDEFCFYNAKDEDDLVIFGRLNADGTFCFSTSDGDENEVAYTFYVNGVGADENKKLYFDVLNGVKYSVRDGEYTTDSKGQFTITDDGEYVITFDDGTNMTVMLRTATVDGKKENVFVLRNDEEYGLGELNRYVLYEGSLRYYYAYQIVFDGYGVAKFYTAADHASFVSYDYSYNADTDAYTLKNGGGSTVATIKIYDFGSNNGYMFYSESLDNEFVGEDGTTLVLDGCYVATLCGGENSVPGYFDQAASSSEFGDMIINFYGENGELYRFILDAESVTVEKEVEGEGGEPTTVTEKYRQQIKNAEYGEYYFQVVSGKYFYSPLFTFESEKDIDVYVKVDGKYELAARGEYVINAAGAYVLTIKEYLLEKATVPMGDLNDIATVEFYRETATISSSNGTSYYNFHYWNAYVDVEGARHESFDNVAENAEGEEVVTPYEFKKVYTALNGDTLTIMGEFATYAGTGVKYHGQGFTSSGLYYISDGEDGYIFFEINDGDMTFEVVKGIPYTATVSENGMVVSTDEMAFDGKGGATYTITVKTTDGEDEVTETTVYVGTVTETGDKSLSGLPVYKFVGTAEAKEGGEEQTIEFTFLDVTLSSGSNYVFKHNDTYCGEFESENYESIEFDGFGLYAEYTYADGEKVTGYYYVAEDADGNPLIGMYFGEQVRYFDIDGNAFTRKGEEYGTYILFDNMRPVDTQISLDGYGTATVSEYDTEKEVWGDKIQVGYTVSGDEISIEYTYGAAEKEYVLKADADVCYYRGDVYNVLKVNRSEIAYTFINDNDYSVLKLDAYNNAVLFTKDGAVVPGSYLIITDSLLYFVTDDNTDAAVFDYDTASASAKKLDLKQKGYYNENLEGFRFTQYGFAIFNGTDRYYYNVDDNGEVTIYLYDESSPDANRYGFVGQNIGTFENSIEFLGETYYYNDGFRIKFTRETDSSEDYPVMISGYGETKYAMGDLFFSPTGEKEFSVSGTIYANGLKDKEFSVTVVRKSLGEGEYETYVYASPFYFHIEVSYKGVNDKDEPINTYRVTGLETKAEYTSYSYYYLMMLYYYMYGTVPTGVSAEEWGVISFKNVYDEKGDIAEKRFDAQFGASSGLIAPDGSRLVIPEGTTYDYDEQQKIYNVRFTAEDGYEYALHIYLPSTSYYRIVAYTRIQRFEEGDYVVEIERLLATEGSYRLGSVWSIDVYEKNGDDLDKIESAGYFTKDGKICYVVRTYNEEDLITSSKYFFITLKARSATSEDKLATPIESCLLEEETGHIYYSEDKQYYIEISDTLGALIFGVKGETGYANNVIYASENNGDDYTVVINSGEEFNVAVSEGKIVVNEIPRVAYERAKGDTNNYLALGTVRFVPQDGEEYTVRATVEYDGSVYHGTLTRKLVGEDYVTTLFVDPLLMTVTLSEQAGEGEEVIRTYTINGISSETEYVNYNYFIQEEGGENEYGSITVKVVYGKDGKAVSRTVSARFGDAGDMVYPEGLKSFDDVEFNYNSDIESYYVTLKSTDGYDYVLYFVTSSAGYYRVVAIARSQTLVTLNDYSVTVEVVVATEYPEYMSVGDVLSVRLFDKNAVSDLQEIKGLEFVKADNDNYYLYVKEKDKDGVVTDAECYILSITLSEGWAHATYSPIGSVTVFGEEVTGVYYVAESDDFVIIGETKGLLVMHIDGVDYAVCECYYDMDTDTYYATLENGRKFSVRIDTDYNAVIEEIVEEVLPE